VTTPDTTTETDERVDDLIYAIEVHFEGPDYDAIKETLAPYLAAIRRQAAADALTEQSRSLAKLGGFMRKQASSHVRSGREQTAITYEAMADTYYGSANKLTKAAADKLAEGYDFVCAAQTWATRDDPGYGCETRVPDAGDFCNRHEPEDDEDRWAE
jgi:hypothetical protein